MSFTVSGPATWPYLKAAKQEHQQHQQRVTATIVAPEASLLKMAGLLEHLLNFSPMMKLVIKQKERDLFT